MLTENKSSANSSFGINRKITANYRGMTDEECDEILRTQKVQQAELNVSLPLKLHIQTLNAIHVLLLNITAQTRRRRDNQYAVATTDQQSCKNNTIERARD